MGFIVRVPSVTKEGVRKKLSRPRKKRGPKNPKGRGPTKGLNVKEPMYLEYDKRGQPCGRWRRIYGKHVGLSMRKLNIAMTWDEVPDGLKRSMSEDTMNLFHIKENDSDSLQRIGWLCPQEIRGAKCLADSSDVKYYLEHSIQQCRRVGKVIIIAPYHQDTHWMLVVISTTTNTVYQFDSARVVPLRMLLLKSCLNNVLLKLSGVALRRDSIPKWKSMKCAQQQGAVECGYYVMRYIYDIVSYSVEDKDLEAIFNTPREGPFTSTEINEVRDKCATIITDTYL